MAEDQPTPSGESPESRAFDPTEVEEEFRAARRLYDAAGLVHERGDVHGVDSVLVVHPALRQLLRLLLRLSGKDGTGTLEEMADAAAELNEKESLVEFDLRADLLLVEATHRQATSLGTRADPALARRYDRAFLRAGRLFSAARGVVDSRTGGKDRERSHRVAVFVALAVAVGVVVGYRLPRKTDVPADAPSPPPPSAVEPAGLLGTFFGAEDLTKPLFTRKDSSIDFSWGGDAPPGSNVNDHFSVRWVGRIFVPEGGEYGFRLSSDDGSRLFVDDRPVVDSWSVHTLEPKEGSVNLTPGLHPIRVEYFDGTGDATVKLEWRGPKFDFRLASGEDFR
ncbi:MAG TPA: PA14 domain-containing protein [Polyangiaceae bacterium]|nr:PA14 domain-containing protein [Polyangiaceae bacterium]